MRVMLRAKINTVFEREDMGEKIIVIPDLIGNLGSG